MLGEDHALALEFPEFKNIISMLVDTDQKFAQDSTRYHELDKEIRELEIGASPIGDDAMHRLKVERSALKDTLYQKLKDEGEQ